MGDSQKTSTSNFFTINNIFAIVDRFIEEHNLIPIKKVTIVLACSGGPDSVLLAEYLGNPINKKKYEVILVYIDHEWRPESKQEIDFCKRLAERHQFLFETTTLDQIKARHSNIKINGSKEAYARELRYIFLQEVAKKYNATHIMLGHHQDDQIETFFIRLIRGTSLTGLCAMQPQNGLFIRPLLGIKKIQIMAFLDQNKIQYCVDSSNNDPQYLRNRIRNNLIPMIETIDHRSKNNISLLIERLQNAENCLEQITKETFETIATKKDDTISIDIQKLLDLQKELQYRVLLHFLIVNNVTVTYSERLFLEILRFLQNTKSGTHKIGVEAVLKKEFGNLRVLQ